MRVVTWADRNRPQGWRRLAAPLLGLGLLGVVSIWFPQLLGNGRDISQLAFTNQAAPALLLIAACAEARRDSAVHAHRRSRRLIHAFPDSRRIARCCTGAYLVLVLARSTPGLFAVVGAAAVLAATTQGPISTVVLMMELTGRDRSFILPLLLAVATATLVARTIEPRSIYDARLTDEEVAARRKLRELPPR